MAGLSTNFSEDSTDVFLFQTNSHRRGQILCCQHSSCWNRCNVNAGNTQQKTEHTGADVADIGCTLSHQFIIDIGKHLDIHLAHRVQSSFCTASGSDHFFHLTSHKRVTEHHDLTAEDFRFFFADSLANILCHLLCHFAKSIYRFF